jgi:DNA replication protein DnaC
MSKSDGRGVGSLAEAIGQAMQAFEAVGPEREAEWQKQREADELFERVTQRTASLQPIRDQLPPEAFRAIVNGTALKSTSALDGVKAWLSDPKSPSVLVLSGPTGCGKTVAMAYALAETGGRWMTCAQLARRSAAHFGDEAEDYERMLRARVLFVDDVGTERMSAEHVASMLVELLEKRQSLRTLLTTNLSGSDFAKRYRDERLMSRIQRVEWLSAKGEDLRRAK